MATAKAPRIVDGTVAKEAVVDKGPTARYRVLRPILHGKVQLLPGDLVDLKQLDAVGLVETLALVPHIVPEQVARVVDLTSNKVKITAASEQVTATEAAAEEAQATGADSTN